MPIKKYNRLFILFLFVSVILQSSSCFSQSPASPEPPSKKIRIGLHKDYPPFALINKNGVLSGMNIDITESIGKAMGLDCEFVYDDLAKIISALESGQIDVIDGIYYSEERKKTLNFSNPIISVSHGLFVRAGFKKNISHIRDLSLNNTVTIVNGDITGDYISENNIRAKVVPRDTLKEAITDLSLGKADAALLPILPAFYLMKDMRIRNVKRIGKPFKPLAMCYAVRHGDDQLLAKLNEGLAVIKADGDYDEIVIRRLGVLSPINDTLERFMPFIFLAILIITLVFAVVTAWTLSLAREVKRSTKALEVANLELRNSCLKDELTLLFNYRYFQERLSAEFKRAKRNLESLALMLVDIDYLKATNDAYGHKFGDIVLREFADLLRHTVRENDVVFRYSGSGFGVLLPVTTCREGLIASDRIQEKTRLHVFRHELISAKIHISIGLSAYPEDGIASKEELQRCADEALRKSKEAGGDRSMTFHDIYKMSEDELKAAILEKADTEKLKDKFLKMTRRINETYIDSINALAGAVEAKDYYTIEHSNDVQKYAVKLAKAMGFSDSQIEVIKFASILHDIGKIGISEQILLKKGKLTKEEFDIVKTHPVIAVDILKSVRFLERELPSIRHHHEWWDGTGYPDGLKGDEIPLGARILAIADTYTALVSDRSYRKAYSKNDAVEILKQEKGAHLDPELTNVFIKILDEEDKGSDNFTS